MTKDLDTEKLLPFIPLKRFGTAEEVAGEFVFFLLIFSCSCSCSYSCSFFLFSSFLFVLLLVLLPLLMPPAPVFLLFYSAAITSPGQVSYSGCHFYIFFVFISSPPRTFHRICRTSHHYDLVFNTHVLTVFLQDW
jgi:hypothetical protein